MSCRTRSATTTGSTGYTACHCHEKNAKVEQSFPLKQSTGGAKGGQKAYPQKLDPSSVALGEKRERFCAFRRRIERQRLRENEKLAVEPDVFRQQAFSPIATAATFM